MIHDIMQEIKFRNNITSRYPNTKFLLLQTFSQLCYFDFILSVTGLHSAPWTIIDKPRFPYRGLLIGMMQSEFFQHIAKL